MFDINGQLFSLFLNNSFLIGKKKKAQVVKYHFFSFDIYVLSFFYAGHEKLSFLPYAPSLPCATLLLALGVWNVLQLFLHIYVHINKKVLVIMWNIFNPTVPLLPEVAEVQVKNRFQHDIQLQLSQLPPMLVLSYIFRYSTHYSEAVFSMLMQHTSFR